MNSPSRGPRLQVLLAFALVVGAAVLPACRRSASVGDDGLESAAASVTAAELRAHVEFLADDLLEGREVGTRGMALGALYVASRYTEMGLEPAGDDGGFVQTIPMRRSLLDEEESRLVIDGLRGGRPLTPGQDWVGSPRFGAASADVDAEAVFVGYGIDAPARGHADYAEADLTGKVAVALWGAPPTMSADDAAHFAAGKEAAAVEHGAVGLIQLATPQLESLAPWAFLSRIGGRPAVAWLDDQGRPFGRSGELSGVAMLSPETSRALLEAGGIDMENAIEAASVAGSGRTLPLAVRMHTASAIEEVIGRNVVARIPATVNDGSAEAVVITAHLDHDGIGPPRDGDSIYNGAVDNASGVAALLEVAEAMVGMERLPRAVYFVATDAEEKGLLGAEYFVARPPLPLERIVADVNLDGNHMLFPTRDVIVLGADRSSLEAVVARAAAAEGLELSADPMPEQGFFTRSDHYPFVKKGIPSAFMIGGFLSGDEAIDGRAVMEQWLGTVYHTPADDLSQELHWESGAAYARVALRIAVGIARDPERPTWNPGDFFGETFGPDRVRR